MTAVAVSLPTASEPTKASAELSVIASSDCVRCVRGRSITRLGSDSRSGGNAGSTWVMDSSRAVRTSWAVSCHGRGSIAAIMYERMDGEVSEDGSSVQSLEYSNGQ